MTPPPAPAPQTPPPTPTPMPPAQSSSSIGPILGAIVIVALLAAGGIYAYMTWEDRSMTQQEQGAAPTTDTQAQDLQQTSSSDEVADLEADLSATSETNASGEVDTLEQSF